MKAQFQYVTIPAGCSVHVLNRRISQIPFEWHHHAEIELTLTLNSRGWRFIGDHVGAYDSHDLVLIPPEMPHAWTSTKAIDESSPHVVIVVWFTEAWALQLADACPEYASLRKLIKRAAGGLGFPAIAGAMMESRLSGLLSDAPRERLRTALDVLSELAETDAIPLATPLNADPVTTGESTQLRRILNVLHTRFAEPIRMRDLCAAGNMSERSLHRMFVRHTGKNTTDYLCWFRIGRACVWLVETDRPISVIAADAGFFNLSNFNRRFRAVQHMSPREFRRYHLEHGSLPERDQFDLTATAPSPKGTGRRNVKPMLTAT